MVHYLVIRATDQLSHLTYAFFFAIPAFPPPDSKILSPHICREFSLSVY